jgi:hypothetical protein
MQEEFDLEAGGHTGSKVDGNGVEVTTVQRSAFSNDGTIYTD